MTGLRMIWEQWDWKSLHGVPTQSRAGAWFAGIGNSGNSLTRPVCVCEGGWVRAGMRAILKTWARAYGCGYNCSHCSQIAESYSWCGFAWEDHPPFSNPTVPRAIT